MKINKLMERHKECCIVCKHCHPCKVLINKGWKYFNICTALFDGSKYEMALVVDDYDMCEMFADIKTEKQGGSNG